MIRRPPRSTQSRSSAASDVYKRQSHRRENFGQPILDICGSIMEIVDSFEDIEVVFSVHRNPKVSVPVQSLLGEKERIHLVEPLDYMDMANLLARSYLIMTDSG